MYEGCAFLDTATEVVFEIIHQTCAAQRADPEARCWSLTYRPAQTGSLGKVYPEFAIDGREDSQGSLVSQGQTAVTLRPKQMMEAQGRKETISKGGKRAMCPCRAVAGHCQSLAWRI